MLKGSDLLVAPLENEGVDRILGAPSKESLDAVENKSSIRWKQAAYAENTRVLVEELRECIKSQPHAAELAYIP